MLALWKIMKLISTFAVSYFHIREDGKHHTHTHTHMTTTDDDDDDSVAKEQKLTKAKCKLHCTTKKCISNWANRENKVLRALSLHCSALVWFLFWIPPPPPPLLGSFF